METKGSDVSELPEVVGLYQDAHDQRDTDAALAAFTRDAVVVDDGHTFHGVDEIRDWLATAASEFTFTRTLVGAETIGANTWLVINHLVGDFPGGVVDLRYKFVLTGNLISELVIAP